uniref:Chromosome X open reading frame 65 n=1 Tax=Anas platyrhynchos TaxID=8839 RepID=A0A8B9T4P5_ANAPL
MFICINHGGESPPGPEDVAGGHCGSPGLSPWPPPAVPTDNQSFLVNTDCPVLLLLSHLRSKVGVPATDVIDVCDKLGTPKLLFQVKTLQERASEFLPAPGTYYVCRVELGTPCTPVPVLVPPSPSPSPCHPCPRVTPTPPCRARRQHEAQHDLARSRRGLPAGPRSPRGGGSSGRGSAEPNKAAGPPAPGHRD